MGKVGRYVTLNNFRNILQPNEENKTCVGSSEHSKHTVKVQQNLRDSGDFMTDIVTPKIASVKNRGSPYVLQRAAGRRSRISIKCIC